MPLSTSSKIRVGTEEVPARTSFSANMKRDSSPPEAMRASGPNPAPGFVATSKCTRSQPCSPQSFSARAVSTVRKRALSRRSGFSSAATPASRRAAESGLRPGIAVELADRLGQGFGQTFGVLQQCAAGGEAILFVFLRREQIELVQMMPQQILFVAAPRKQPHRLRLAPLGFAP